MSNMARSIWFVIIVAFILAPFFTYKLFGWTGVGISILVMIIICAVVVIYQEWFGLAGSGERLQSNQCTARENAKADKGRLVDYHAPNFYLEHVPMSTPKLDTEGNPKGQKSPSQMPQGRKTPGPQQMSNQQKPRGAGGN